jgi:hypothetical protein
MNKHFAIAAAAALLLSSGTAFAAKEDAPAPTAKEQSAPAANAKTRYCINVGVVTGSIVQGRQCKTLKQWQADGVDPTRKLPS